MRMSQSALEYMMTYGWAILIIVIVAEVLYSLGVFSPSNAVGTTVVGFAGFQATAACAPNGVLALKLSNGVGYTVNITRFNVTYNGKTVENPQIGNEGMIIPGATGTFFSLNGCANASSSHYFSSATITYTEPGQVFGGPYVSSGTVSGVTSTFSQNTVANFTINQSQIYIPNSSTTYNLWQGNPYTLSAWVKLTTDSATCTHYPCTALTQVEYGCTSGTQDFKANVSGFWVNELEWNVTHAGCGNGQTSPSMFVPFNKWAQVTGVFGYNKTSSSYYVEICVDGVCESGPYTLNHPGYQGTGATAVGAYQLQGKIANVQIYSSALTGNQIKESYAFGIGGIPVVTNGLVAWLPLDGNANDYSGNGNDGQTAGINWVPT